MTPREFQVLALRTESTITKLSPSMLNRIRTLHASLGICDEAGELAKTLKDHIFYEKPWSDTYILEELGDLLWYIALLLDAVGLTFSEVFEANIRKLKTRYPEKFTTEDALHRDLDKEKEALDATE